MPNEASADEIRAAVKASAPLLWDAAGVLAEQLLEPALRRLDRRAVPTFPKTINDPIWGGIELLPWETVIVDSPLLQRLRGIRQLGMAHHVYPGAGHSRFEHSLGVLEAADRIMRALERNAANRREFGPDRDESIPSITGDDRVAIRLAALLHDVGHGPFSHATEVLLRAHNITEFESAENTLRRFFIGAGIISTSETLAVLLVLSYVMRRVLVHDQFQARVRPADFATAIAARIIGSRSYLSTSYLAGAINGPLDADKLDYMARDSYHSGLPLGLDLDRIINKLEVIVLTAKNAPNADLRRYAEESESGRLYEMGISSAGISAYEQMVIARVFLYDRLYYHHKVRAADAMAQRLILTAEEERGQPFGVTELLCDLPDESAIDALGGRIAAPALGAGGSRAAALAAALHSRDFYHRAYVFAERFIGGVDRLPEDEQSETRQIIWDGVRSAVDTPESAESLREAIYERSLALAKAIRDIGADGERLQREHVLIDFPLSRKVTVPISDERVGASDDRILTRSEGGDIDRPNLFFNPERWSKAWQKHKQSGYVFAPREFVNVVALASQIIFYERFNLVMSNDARRVAKTQGLPLAEWIRQAAAAGLCSAEAASMLTTSQPRFAPFRAADISVPAPWLAIEPNFSHRIAAGFESSLPAGVPASVHRIVIAALQHLFAFIDAYDRVGELTVMPKIIERDLQKALRHHFESRGAPIIEGAEVGGGETDLVFDSQLVIENKVRGETANPMVAGPNYDWQNRRYSLAVSSNVGVTIVGYKPVSEAALLAAPYRVAVDAVLDAPEPRAQIRIAVPYGMSVPSKATAPKM